MPQDNQNIPFMLKNLPYFLQYSTFPKRYFSFSEDIHTLPQIAE
jgi:hypothetical protein